MDIEKTETNESLVPSYGFTYTELWQKRLREAEAEAKKNIKVRSNAVLALDIILTFSKDADVDIEKWKEYNLHWLKSTFGEKNVLTAELHLDETTPHIHSIIIPIDSKNRLAAKNLVGGRSKMFKLQDSYARAMAPLGLQRGERFTRSRKKDLYKFYSALNKASEEPIPPRETDEPEKEYIDRVSEYVKDLKISHLREQLKAKRDVEVAQSRTLQFWNKYKNAVELQNSVEENMDGNKDDITERMQTYINIERAVPRKTLNKVLKTIEKKYPAEEAIRSFALEARRRRKKRKKEKENVGTG